MACSCCTCKISSPMWLSRPIPGVIAEVIKGKYKHRNISQSISHHVATGEVGIGSVSQNHRQMSSPLWREASRGILMTPAAEAKGGRAGGHRVGRGQRSCPAVGSLCCASSGGRKRSQPPAEGHGGWAVGSQPLAAFADILKKTFGMFMLTHVWKRMLGFLLFLRLTLHHCVKGKEADGGQGYFFGFVAINLVDVLHICASHTWQLCGHELCDQTFWPFGEIKCEGNPTQSLHKVYSLTFRRVEAWWRSLQRQTLLGKKWQQKQKCS